MLSRTHRLRSKRDLDIVFKEGKTVFANLATLKFWKIDPEQYPRRSFTSDELKIAIVTSKKVHKSAVKRNKLKRQMREVVRLLIKQGQVKHGYYLVFMAKPAMFEQSYQDIEQNMRFLLKKAKLLQ